jgi:hypothetical protein
MTVITQAGNKEWVENIARRPHTLQPDFLAKNAAPPERRPRSDEEREIKDKSMTRAASITLAGNPHTDHEC